ncbi:MAG: glycosyltransferase family 9 protein [Verrucomicrobiota bacterium]
MSIAQSQPRILVVRGGAIGDFVLTLPALYLLREAFPDTALEILGYPHIAALADKRFYADRVRSIEYGPLAGFFARNASLNRELSEYFAGFQQIISYLYDPDGIFEANVRKAGARNFLSAYRKPQQLHAAREWAQPLESMALFLQSPAALLFPSPEDFAAALAWVGGDQSRMRLAMHPGSGSQSKNWGAECWVEVGNRFLEQFPEGELVVVGGEADAEVIQVLQAAWSGIRVRFALHLPLSTLAALIALCGRFAGHDSGIAHIAAATGARCVVLFGPTDPEIWAPQNEGVRVLRAPFGDWLALQTEEVWGAVNAVCSQKSPFLQ